MDQQRDDDVYAQYSGRRGGRRYYQQYHEQQGHTKSSWETIEELFHYLTRSRSSIVVALVVIVAIQSRSTIMLWLDMVQAQGLWNTLLDLLFHALDALRVYYRTCQEFLRTVQTFFGLSIDDDGNGGEARAFGPSTNRLPPLVTDEEEDDTSPVVNVRSKNNRKRKGKKNQPPLRNQSIPGLEPSQIEPQDARVAKNKPLTNGLHHCSDDYQNGHSNKTKTNQDNLHRNGEIEPAFLKEGDYPSGWLVFHQELGVVTKGEADAFDTQLDIPKQHQSPG